MQTRGRSAVGNVTWPGRLTVDVSRGPSLDVRFLRPPGPPGGHLPRAAAAPTSPAL